MRERQREIESVSEYRNTSGTVYINIKKDWKYAELYKDNKVQNYLSCMEGMK